MLSLRTQVLLGAILWTIGLLVLSMAGLALVFRYFPEMPFFGRSGAIHYWVFHTAPMVLAAVVIMIAGVLQVRSGLSAIARLRSRLGAVHDGRTVRVDGRYPPEVQPLVDDLNALLDSREGAIRRAVARAGDMAHGLKTPLAVLAQEAERAEAAGHAEMASAVGEQVERMRRQVDYHLAHARAAASGPTAGARSAVKDAADALARTLLRLHAGRDLRLDILSPPDHAVRVQREDADEMLGNLLDNACKWASERIVLESLIRGTDMVITVDDDGTGLEPAMRAAVLERGVRADERAPGSGLGLAIVRDLAEVYGGSVALDESPLGGLRATLTLPSAS